MDYLQCVNKWHTHTQNEQEGESLLLEMQQNERVSTTPGAK